MKLANLVKSKYFCYFTYALMVINLLGYVSTGAMECVVVFTLATFACKSCLTKNMCLCIFGGLFVSNILFGCSKVKEGFREGNEAAPTKTDLQDQLKTISEKLENIEDVKDEEEGENTDDSAEGEEVKEGKKGFRNMRRNRRRAVREAFSTIHRAVRSY